MMIGLRKKSEKKTPFTIVTNNMKYFGLHLIKQARDLYGKNFEERNRRRQQKMGRVPMFLGS